MSYFMRQKVRKVGLVRELNPGPLAPEARIIPLDQRANDLLHSSLSHPSFALFKLTRLINIFHQTEVKHGLFAFFLNTTRINCDVP